MEVPRFLSQISHSRFQMSPMSIILAVLDITGHQIELHSICLNPGNRSEKFRLKLMPSCTGSHILSAFISWANVLWVRQFIEIRVRCTRLCRWHIYVPSAWDINYLCQEVNRDGDVVAHMLCPRRSTWVISQGSRPKKKKRAWLGQERFTAASRS